MSSKREKVIVAMSGGVDSAVAAAVLSQTGYDVTGVFMCLSSAGDADGHARGCCSPQDAADARRVANALGIDMYVLNFGPHFQRIIDYFADEYLRGRTPNPCIHCNTHLKFGRLFAHADQLGIRYVATGHHARIARAADHTAIFRGRAPGKDQSYALFGIAAEYLDRMLLPIGEIDDKNRVRDIARSLDLNVHDKPDSQEICFVPDDDYAAVVRARRPSADMPGNVVDSAGNILGRHDGIAGFTIGQRRGLGIAAGVPMYVTRIDAQSATVTIGPKDALLAGRLRASGANWHCSPRQRFPATVQIRYNHPGSPGNVTLTSPDTFDVEFDSPVSAVTPGQAAVVYDGDQLLGGGWID